MKKWGINSTNKCSYSSATSAPVWWAECGSNRQGPISHRSQLTLACSGRSWGKHTGVLLVTWQETNFGQGTTIVQVKHFPLRQIPIGGINTQDQPAGFVWIHSPFSTSDLFNWKNKIPTYWEDTTRMENLFFSIFATHSPNWADVHSLLTPLLAEEERRVVIEKAREETDRMHASAPNKPIQAPAANAIPTTDPGRDWEWPRR